jgi:hypothetical protein
VICEQAWNQGIDLYGYDNNRVLAGAEYVAKGNLLQADGTYPTMPYAYYNSGSVIDTVFATGAQGDRRPIWSMISNHYINRKGLAAPYSQKFTALMQPEGGGGNYGPNSGGYDQLGYGTLAFTRDAIASGAGPSGLTAVTTAGQVELSWWGSAYAGSYNLKRGTAAGGPYNTIATGISDLLTYTDSGLPDGTWYYVVTAVTAGVESAPSNEASAVTGLKLDTYLPFDQSSGPTASDASGNGHNGSLNGGASWTAGRSGNAVALDGSSGYVSLPDTLGADLGDFSIAAWAYWNGGSPNQRVFDFGTSTDHYMFLTPRHGSGVVRFAMSLTSYRAEQAISGSAALPVRKWSHVAVTLSGTTATLYIDGVAVGTNTTMIFAPFRLGSPGNNWLGRSQVAADPYFNGLLDEFRLYRGALSAAQVAALAGS